MTDNISPKDRLLAQRLLNDIYSRFYFDPEMIATWLLDMVKRGKLLRRPGIVIARFPGVDSDAVARPYAKMSL